MDTDSIDLYEAAEKAFPWLEQFEPDLSHTVNLKEALKGYTVILQYPLETLEHGSEAVETYTWVGEADNEHQAADKAREHAEKANDGDITDFPVLFVFRGKLRAECKGDEMDG